jgi:tetratricopeptide (TPR) repeat protein
MDIKFDKIISEGEEAREREDYPRAFERFDQAIVLAATKSDLTTLINALAHKLLIYKNLYQKTGNNWFNELMAGDAKTGLKIVEKSGLLGQPKAVILLRLGDYHINKKNYELAATAYKEGLENSDVNKPGEYAEYLSHLAWAQGLMGDKDAIAHLKKSLEIAESDTNLRPFHRLVILSGINMRLAEVYKVQDNPEESLAALDIAEKMAKELQSEFHMPMRLKQAGLLRSQLQL